MCVILSVGSNEGNRKDNIRKALCEISYFAKIVKVSKPLKTKPYGNPDQPDFINLVLIVETSLDPFEFLEKCQIVEKKLGRVRKERWGKRTIDIDILFWGNEIINTDKLQIPHYDLENREFVLKPLVEIMPEFVHPVSRKTVSTLYKELLKKSNV